MSTTLSTRQQAILEFIQHEVQKKGYPPSVREIGKAVGLSSSSTVHGHLHRLEKRGYLRRDATKPRAIEVLASDEATNQRKKMYLDTVMIPLVGKVTAGEPITAIENVEEYYPLPRRTVGNDETGVFLLSVQGDSMINAGIHDGDYVLVKQQHTAENGEIVVVLTPNNEATVKRIYKEENKIRLQPENNMHKPLIVSDVNILGKVIGLVREML